MAKNYHDPEFGEMIGIAEVELLTGITKAQLRNWRKPEHHHLAKFDIYEGVGNAVWYRKMDIEAYLAEHGALVGQSGLKRVSMPNSISAPLIDVKYVGEQRDAFQKLTKVTSANVHSWVDTTFETKGLAWADTWQKAWATIEQELGLEPKFVLHWQRWDHPEFWNVAVHTVRYLINEEQGLGFDLPGIIALGDSVAPEKEVKF
jgi:hypothetical protein